MEYRSELKKFMTDRGIKQSWLAEESNLRQSWLSKIVNDKTKVNVFDAQKIVRALRKAGHKDVTIEMLWPLPDK